MDGFGGWYIGSMKVKTSITLSQEVLAAIDKFHPNRSEFLEKAARSYLRALRRAERDARDRALYEKYAAELNQQALETLEYSAYYNEEDERAAR